MDRVVDIAGDLAGRWDLDVGLARLMAQAHDVVRHLDDAEWLLRATEYGIEPDPIERSAPVLLHGPVGAEELRRHYAIDDERVLHAVHWHTPGHPDYTPEAWAMFVADKVEPEKAKHWDVLKAIRRTAEADGLELAALQYLDARLRQSIDRETLIHPAMLRTRNVLRERHGSAG